MRLILKFGGSSLSSIKKIKEVAQFISNLKKRKNLELIIVVSAMGKTTNMLESLANKFDCCKLSSTYGALLTIGENISNYLLCMALEELNINAVSLTCKDIKITASGSVDFGIITHIDKTKIENYLLENKVVIVSGFQGENSHGQIITLGRGGSDTTAVALGHTLNANVKIYTDVNGFYSVNPAQYQNAKLLKNIYIKSAIELANVNAKVLDYRALCLLNQNKTPLTVAKSLSNNSTTVSFKPVENYQIDGISCKNKISFVKNTIKYSHFLQTINQNLNYKNYFYNKSDYEILATEAPKKIISTIASVNKINLNIKESAIALVAGSGFVTHKIFMQKTQNLLNKLKIKPIYLNLTQTNLTLIISKSKAKILEKSLAIEFNLIKEN